mmetsp:Transcript_28194/g.52906  ORF Transcript_28194/g.52906 Transcript_28194/m.52906 type:complete len:210 (-) Transcript_28194:181-810(-)
MAGAKGLSSSASSPVLGAQPGGPWVNRKFDPLLSVGKHVVMPPMNEAAAVAWKARRKATLQGQLGTGNSISSVVQYPVSTRDPDNMCSNYKRHLSAEDRRILRVRVKHHMRGKPSWPDNVYEAEKVLLQTFAKSPELCTAFYLNNDFCEKLLTDAAVASEHGVYQDAPAHTQLRMNNPNWEESVQSRVAVAAAEVLRRLAESSPNAGRL